MRQALTVLLPTLAISLAAITLSQPGHAQTDGTTPTGAVVATCSEVLLASPIAFASNDDAIAPESQPMLAELAALLTSSPWIGTLEIHVHTDAAGSSAYNQRISAKRAQAIRNQLISLGISDERLVAQGDGENFPIASNETAAGREQNRRVELRIVVSGTCPLAP